MQAYRRMIFTTGKNDSEIIALSGLSQVHEQWTTSSRQLSIDHKGQAPGIRG